MFFLILIPHPDNNSFLSAYSGQVQVIQWWTEVTHALFIRRWRSELNITWLKLNLQSVVSTFWWKGLDSWKTLSGLGFSGRFLEEVMLGLGFYRPSRSFLEGWSGQKTQSALDAGQDPGYGLLQNSALHFYTLVLSKESQRKATQKDYYQSMRRQTDNRWQR